MVQIVVIQCIIIWGPLLLFLFEYDHAAKMLIVEQFPNASKSPHSLDISSKILNFGEVRLSVSESVRELKLETQVKSSGLSGRKVRELATGERADATTWSILIRVWRKLIRNQNIYSSLVGIILSLILTSDGTLIQLSFTKYSSLVDCTSSSNCSIHHFMFAKEYNVHLEILCNSVIFGMVVAIPVTLIYYILLGL